MFIYWVYFGIVVMQLNFVVRMIKIKYETLFVNFRVLLIMFELLRHSIFFYLIDGFIAMFQYTKIIILKITLTL